MQDYLPVMPARTPTSLSARENGFPGAVVSGLVRGLCIEKRAAACPGAFLDW